MCVILLSCVLRRLVVFCRTSRMSPAGLLTFGFGEVTRLTVPSRVALEGRKSTTHVAGGGNSATLCASSVALCALSRLCLLLRWRCCAHVVGWADLFRRACPPHIACADIRPRPLLGREHACLLHIACAHIRPRPLIGRELPTAHCLCWHSSSPAHGARALALNDGCREAERSLCALLVLCARCCLLAVCCVPPHSALRRGFKFLLG